MITFILANPCITLSQCQINRLSEDEVAGECSVLPSGSGGSTFTGLPGDGVAEEIFVSVCKKTEFSFPVDISGDEAAEETYVSVLEVSSS